MHSHAPVDAEYERHFRPTSLVLLRTLYRAGDVEWKPISLTPRRSGIGKHVHFLSSGKAVDSTS